MNPAALAVLVVALVVAGVLFGRRAIFLYRLVRMGKPVARLDDIPGRARAEAVVVLGQSKLLQRLLPGLMHAAIAEQAANNRLIRPSALYVGPQPPRPLPDGYGAATKSAELAR